MPLYTEAKQAVMDAILQENGVELPVNEYNTVVDFHNPTTAPLGFNAKVTITPVNPASQYTGSVDVFIKRLDLADLETMVNFGVGVGNSATLHEAIPFINSRFGLAFTENDLIDQSLPTLPATITIQADSGSLGWTGQADLYVYESDLDLGTAIETAELPGFNYPTNAEEKMFAATYSYWRDFSDAYPYLSTIQNGDPVDADFRDFLNENVDEVWTLDPESDYSLAGATIVDVVNGIPSNSEQYNFTYDSVISVLLNEENCLNVSGNLIIHFNAPIDPEIV
jgi:hypothetical protein